MADNNSLDPEKLEKLNKLLGKNNDELNDFAKSLKEADEATEKTAKRLKELGGFVKDLGATHLSTEQGMAKYGKSMTTATDAIGDVVGEFGILGKAVGFFIKQLGGLAAASLKQQDALMKSYRTLSDFGAIDSSGLKGVLDNMLAMGGNTEQVENFHRTLKAMAPDLVTFGGTVAEGAKKFSQVTNTMLTKGIEDNLKNLGYTTEDIVKYGGQYIAMQAKSGSLNTKNTGELATQSANYMKTLSELTMLTGASRDQAQEAFESQQRDLAFRLKMQELESSNQGDQAKRLKEIVAGVMLTNKDLGNAMMEQIANEGGIVTEKTAQMVGQYPELYNKVQKLSRETGDTALGTMEMMKSEIPNIQRIIAQFGATGKISAEGAAQLGLSVETLNMLEKLRNTDTKKFREEMDKITAGSDPRIKANTELERSERNSKKGMEALTFAVGEVAVPMVNTLAKVMNRLGAAIADVVYWLTKNFSTTTIDIRGAFKEFTDLAEVTKTLKEEQERQAKLAPEIEKNDKELLALRTKEAELEKKSKYRTDMSADEYQASLKSGQELRDTKKKREELEARQHEAKSEMATSKSTTQSAQAASTGMTGSAGSAVAMGTKDLAGLRIKQGDVQKEGAVIDPKLIALAKQIQEQVPGLAYFSSFNDNFHQDKKSNHNKGLALDFVLADSIKGDKEAGEKITAKLKALGASSAIDEYNNPSSNSTAGHIHAEVSGKTQGMFKGPESGYWLKAHGEEALMNQQGLSNLITKAQMPGAGGPGDDIIGMMQETMNQMTQQMEQMVSILQRSQNTHEEILTYSKV